MKKSERFYIAHGKYDDGSASAVMPVILTAYQRELLEKFMECFGNPSMQVDFVPMETIGSTEAIRPRSMPQDAPKTGSQTPL